MVGILRVPRCVPVPPYVNLVLGGASMPCSGDPFLLLALTVAGLGTAGVGVGVGCGCGRVGA